MLIAGPPPRTRRRFRLPNRQGASPDRGPRRWVAAAAAAVAVLLVLVAAFAFRLGSSTPSASSTPTPTPTPASSATPLTVTALYQRVAPSVVLITTSKGALGSGTIVTDTGNVLTADHVVSGGGTVSVTFADGTRTTATIASADAKSDVAMLVPAKLPEVVVPAALGGTVAVGADVVAIGNPLGLRDSTTSGVVSGLNRTAQTKQGTGSGLIKFDAAVNPGSSGGPLLDSQGSVIGVVLSIANPGKEDAFAGIGFAVPIGAALGGAAGKGPGGGPQL
jgi:S1-C subfamily serine protease